MVGKVSQDSHGKGRLTNRLKVEKEERDLCFGRSPIITHCLCSVIEWYSTVPSKSCNHLRPSCMLINEKYGFVAPHKM